METKEKKTSGRLRRLVPSRAAARLLLLVALTLLLGLGIQLALVPLSARREAAEEAARAAAEAAEEAARQTPAPPAATPAPTPAPPTVEEGDILLLVNRWNPLPEGCAPELAEIGDQLWLDARCAQALLDMTEACAQAGGQPVVCSAYRTWEDQRELYEDKIRRLTEAGWDEALAPEEASYSVAVPGASEHQLGLAADIIDHDYVRLDQGQEETFTQQWLMENCWRYGFILRYPNGTTELTGIIYEPWHYRYVGPHAAQEIAARGLTLEEYLALLDPDGARGNS